jgi:hypothetical protein
MTAIDNELSETFETLNSLKPSDLDTSEHLQEKSQKRKHIEDDRCCTIDSGKTSGSAGNGSTLFVNASIKGEGTQPVQSAWVVELVLREHR